jgi:putative ABC transport system permease protein
MLNHLISDQVLLGLAQAGVTIVLALGVMLLARYHAIHLERETIVALVRGLVQVVAVGSILVVLLQGPNYTSVFILAAMTLAAAAIAARRAKGIRGAFRVSLAGIAIGSALVIIPMTWLGVIDPALTSLVPVGSMLIANAMNSNALALDRFRGEVEAHVGEVEAGLALGGDPRQIIMPQVRAAVHASLIPRVDTLRSLGIVWIPGLMAGMILAGSDPVYAAIYQFVVIAMIFASSGITSLVSTLMIRDYAFSEADQLLLRRQSRAPKKAAGRG